MVNFRRNRQHRILGGDGSNGQSCCPKRTCAKPLRGHRAQASSPRPSSPCFCSPFLYNCEWWRSQAVYLQGGSSAREVLGRLKNERPADLDKGGQMQPAYQRCILIRRFRQRREICSCSHNTRHGKCKARGPCAKNKDATADDAEETGMSTRGTRSRKRQEFGCDEV